jgi:hypothetical protein
LNADYEKGDFMKRNVIRNLIAQAAVGLLALAGTAIAARAADYAVGGSGSPQIGNDLIGAWVLVGTPGKVNEAPAAGGRYKFFTGKFSCISQADPKTGVVMFHHGGPYHVEGSDYFETVQYADPSTMQFIGGTNGHFTAKIQDGTLTLIGVGNPWKEVWKRADETAGARSQLGKQLVGTWVLEGGSGNAEENSAPGGRFKFITGSHWLDTQADPKTGVVVYHHGGTYTLTGDEYVQSVAYANPTTMKLIGEAFKFKIKIEGDALTLTGIGNPWNENWKRLK